MHKGAKTWSRLRPKSVDWRNIPGVRRNPTNTSQPALLCVYSAMVLPDTYERQMIWWKSHREAVSATVYQLRPLDMGIGSLHVPQYSVGRLYIMMGIGPL